MLKLTLLFLVLLIESKALALGRGGRVPCGPIVPGFEEFMSYSSEHFYDSDDDGAPEWDSRVWICSGDNIGHYYTIEDTDNPSLERSYDCDPNDKRYWAWYTVYGPDADGDSFPSVVTEPHEVCAGPSEHTYWGWDLRGEAPNGLVDCDDSDFTINVGRVFTDTDKDGAVDSYDLESCTPELVASTKVVSRHTVTMYGTRPGVKEIDDLPPLDCAKNNPSLKAGASFYLDADQDGLGAGKPTYLCGEILNGVMSEVTAPVGYSNHSGDCNDSNPDVQRDCKMEWKLDSYYGADQKPKRLVSHPDGNPTFGKDLNIQLSTYLEYDGDDKDQLIYEVECEVCKEETPSNGYFKGEVIANARGEFRSVAGKHTIHVRAKSEKYGDTAEGAIEIQVYTGDAIVYINGIDTQLQERILVTTDTDCSSGVLMDSFCERGATGALKRLKDLTEYPFVSSISPSSEYYDFSLAYNPSNGIAEDLIKECLPSSIADFDNSPEAEGFGKAIIEFVKFGTSNGLKAFAGATEKLQEALRKRIVESAKEDISHRLDYKSAERIVQNKIREGFRVTLVSHSQGNFISNNLYKNLEMEGKSEYIRQVQIAAPTNFSEDDKNRYVNGKKDIVTFISRGHRPTDLELDCTDPMEHNFIECYVGPDDSRERRSRTMILDYFQQALTELRLNGGN